MRHPLFISLCVSSILVAAIACGPEDETASPDADAGVSSADAAPGEDAGPVDTCGPLDKFERDGGTITTSETWPVGDYLVKGNLRLNATLTIPACTVLRLAPGTHISVETGGALKLLGEETAKVRVTSSNTTPSPGDWGYIEFLNGSSSADSEIHHAIIEYGGKQYGAIFVDGSASVALDHTTIKDSETYGIEARGHLRGAVDNVITGSGTAPAQIYANSIGDLLSGTFTGNASDVILVTVDGSGGGVVNKTATWKNLGVPYRAGVLSVQGDATPQQLTLEAGVTLQMRPGADIRVWSAGGLHLAGTATAPVKITSSEKSPSAGDWSQINFASDSTAGDNIFEHAIIEYGGGGIYGAVRVGNTSLKMTDCTVQHNKKVGLEITDSESSRLREFTGNTFTDNAEGPILARPNLVGQIGAGTYTGNGDNDAIRITGGAVLQNATWGALGVPYRLDGVVDISTNSGTATLTVAAGATLAMGAGTEIRVYNTGVLRLEGTKDKHVTVTAAAANPVPGFWGQISLASLGNSFTYTDISYGGGTGWPNSQLRVDGSVNLDNVTFANSLTNCDIGRDSVNSGGLVTGNSDYLGCVR